MTTCKMADCPLPFLSLGFCSKHYYRFKRTGDPNVVRPRATGSRHGNWTDTPGYGAAHDRVKRLWGSASQYPCVRCGEAAMDWAYDGTDPTELTGMHGKWSMTYSAWPEFYMSVCRSCHLIIDDRRVTA